MKVRLSSLHIFSRRNVIAAVLSFCVFLIGCARIESTPINVDTAEPLAVTESAITEPPVTEPPVTEPPVTEPPVTEPPVTEPPLTEPPVAEPPVTEPPVTEPPVTEPPVTEPPVTEPPVTEPTVTEPPVTEPTVTEPPLTDTKAVAIKSADPSIPSANAETTAAPAAPKGDPLMILTNEGEIIAGADVTGVKTPVASGVGVKTSELVSIDYSNAADGYCMLKYSGSSNERKIVRVLSPVGVTYDYLLTRLSDWNVYPFSEGSGTYKVTLYEQRAAGKYTPLLAAEIAVALKDGYTAFLFPNCFVDFDGASACVKLADYICGDDTELQKVNAVFDYVVDNLSYDYDKAATVAGGYCPDLESAVKTKTGICFDYASLMTAMLRSVGLPTKLVFGYADTVYHAWISVYTAESGWIDEIIRFNGSQWKLMDPTYASTSQRSESVIKRAESGSGYSQVYIY